MMFLLFLLSADAAKKERVPLQPQVRNVFYGYEDCSDASTRSRTLERCGVPQSPIECDDDLSPAIEKCLETCEVTEGCRFVSISKDDNSCSCSLKSLHSLIASSQIDSESDELTTNERRFCNDDMINNESAVRVKNCDREYGCIYQLPNVWTAALDSMDWSFVDACKDRTPVVVEPPMLVPKEKITAPVLHDPKVEMVSDFGARKAGSKVVKVDVPKENVKVNKGGK